MKSLYPWNVYHRATLVNPMVANKKPNILNLPPVALLCLLAAGGSAPLLRAAPAETNATPARALRRARPDREELEYQKRAYPLRQIPPGARARALEQIQQAEQAQLRVAGTGASSAAAQPKGLTVSSWYSLGPKPITDSPYSPSGRCSGRVTTIAVDPRHQTSYNWLIGAAQGGIWQSTNIGVNWFPRTDDQASLSMGAITFAPSNPSTVYAGTGEPNFRGDDYAGAGLLVSQDSGTTWTMLNSSFAETSFSSIKVNQTNANILSVATVRGGGGVTDAASGTNSIPTAPPRGVFISINGGVSFTRVLTGEATDLQVDPNNFDHQYAALGEIYGAPANGVYRTLNRWGSSQLISGPWTELAAPTNMGRISFAIAGSNPNTLYVGIAQNRINYIADIVGFWRTDNAWAATPTWTQLPTPPVNSDGFYSPRYWYYLTMLVDPDDANILYMAEFDVWRYASSSWSTLSGGVHPDNHALAWVIGLSVNNQLLLGNDGGLWLNSPFVPSSWTDLNKDLAITQIYRGAVDPRPSGTLALAGTQDNGTMINAGSFAWPFILGGDGGDCAISSTNPDTDWAYSYDVQYGSTDMYRTQNAGKLQNAVADDLDYELLPDYRQFYVHFEKSPANDDLFIAGTDELWRCNDFFSGSVPSWSVNGPAMVDVFGAPVPISAMAFAPSDTTGQIYAFGTEDGQLRITADGGGHWNDLNLSGAVPRRYISGLAFHPKDTNTLYVTLSGFDEGTPLTPGHAFKTTNALAPTPAWSNVSPPVDLPMNCLAIDPTAGNSIFVGSDLGVWKTSNGGLTWTHDGPAQGMPNVAVFDIRMNSIGQATAFTHGRSAFAYKTVTLPILQYRDSAWLPGLSSASLPPMPSR